MNCGQAQELFIQNYRSDKDYVWSLTSGGGALGSATGRKVVYTAPSANPNCENNPTIEVMDGDGAVGTFSCAINCYSGPEVAYRETSDYIIGYRAGPCCWHTADAPGVCVRTMEYRCDQSYVADSCSDGYSCRRCPAGGVGGQRPIGLCTDYFCGAPYESMGDCIDQCILHGLEIMDAAPPGGVFDLRSETIKGAGCCPVSSLPDYRVQAPIPEEKDYGEVPTAKAPPRACPVTIRGNPVNIRTGNNLEVEQDLDLPSPNRRGFGLERYYNSRSEALGAMGFGWTHTYEVVLNPAFELSHGFEWVVVLRIVDGTGRAAYFSKGDGGRYDGLYGEPTGISTQGDWYVWHQLDGSRFVFDTRGRLSWIEDGVGNRQNLAYDQNGRVQTVTDQASGRIVQFHYRSDGLVSHVTGPVTGAVADGVWVTYGYDESQNLISVGYADGSGMDYIYGDPLDVYNMTEKHDKAGHLLATWAYDGYDRVVEHYSRNGEDLSIAYGAWTEVTDRYGVTRRYKGIRVAGRSVFIDIDGPAECAGCGEDVVRMSYDGQGRTVEVAYANGLIQQFDDFDGRNNPGIVVFGAGTETERVVTFTYHPWMDAKLSQSEPSVLGGGDKVTIWDFDNDENAIPNENPTGTLYRKIEKGFTRDLTGSVVSYAYTTTFAYNGKGQLVSVDGPGPGASDVTTYSYDPTTGDLLSVTRPEIGTTTYGDYDGVGQAGRVTDINGNAVGYTYDGRGRVTAITNDSDGGMTYFTYDTAGEIETVVLPNESATNFSYHPGNGRLARMVDSAGSYIQYGYDANGNPTELSHYDGGGERRFRKRFDYGGPSYPGKLWHEINPDDTYTQYSYDAGGNLESITDAAGKTSLYAHDVFDRLNRITQPGGTRTSFAYDGHGNLASVTDGENHQTSYHYDDQRRLVETVSPDTGMTRYAYDSSGNLISKSDANGTTVAYVYDDLDRLTGIHFPDGSQDITYTYDQGTNGKGRLTGMEDPSGTYSYGYDVLGNLISEYRVIGGIAYTTHYAYDAAGVLMEVTYPNGRTVTYERDDAGQVDSVTTTKDGVTETLADGVDHLPFGPPERLTFGNGTVLSKTYDQGYRLTGSVAAGVQDLGYTLDSVGNVRAITDNLDASRSQAFGYDDWYRLVAATGNYDSVDYTYDKVGNRLSMTRNGEAYLYSYQPGSNRLTTIAGDDTLAFAYDASGNTTAAGSKVFAYNEANRLVQVTEGGSVLAQCTYNGKGQRIEQTCEGETTIFHYDPFGRVIGESRSDGTFLAEYVYLGDTRLAAVVQESRQDVSIRVTTNLGKALAGVPVYAFSEDGSYTGNSETTDKEGLAAFSLADLERGVYRFRADYLGCRFWSGDLSIPEDPETTIEILESTTTVTVMQGGASKEGVTVYLFNDAGQYLGWFGTTNEQGVVQFDLPAGMTFKFRADNLGSRFFSEAVTVQVDETNAWQIDTGGGVLSFSVDKGGEDPIPGVKVYLFDSEGKYLGLWKEADLQGEGAFQVCAGTYRLRVDYLGYQVWSEELTVSLDGHIVISIPHRPVGLTVMGVCGGDVIPRQGVMVYLFHPSGPYLGHLETTDDQGQVQFPLPIMGFKFRADYLGHSYWSPVFDSDHFEIRIDEGLVQGATSNGGVPVDGVHTYAFDGGGTYLGLYGITDERGEFGFRLPAGDYNFRADYLGSQYWSGVTTIVPHTTNGVEISTGGGGFLLTVQKGPGAPIAGLSCYLFSESDSYLGQNAQTDDLGKAAFNVADGSFKIRVDYLGAHHWTEVFQVPMQEALTLDIPHQDVTVSVQGDYQGEVEPRTGVRAYLFSPSGAYLGVSRTTDEQGSAVFNLPDQAYSVRVDYLGQHYWSDPFRWDDSTLTIDEGMAEIRILQGGSPIENASIYVFSSAETYLGVHGRTGPDGVLTLRLPAGTYKFRGDHQGGHYWTAGTVNGHEVSVVDLDAGGGSFALTIRKGEGSFLVDVPVYAFTAGGSYIGVSGRTDESGTTVFGLSHGDYRFRSDYLGYSFWTDVVTVPAVLSDVVTIPHEERVVSAESLYQASVEPMEGLKVYLFNDSGTYMGRWGLTDGEGKVSFSLPERTYKVRVDYLGGQFWSEPFWGTDTAISIPHGIVQTHVMKDGCDVVDARVYLFTPSGTYLARNETTDFSGTAIFFLPEKPFKFRIDHDGRQYWSDVMTVVPHQESRVELALDLLALELTNHPKPVRFNGVPPEFEPAKVLVASVGSLEGLLAEDTGQASSQETFYYYINDHLGTPQKMLDENGTVVWSADYEPFGQADVTIQNVQNNFRFPGQYYDQATGLHYNYFRYYDPNTGRYLTPDPIGLAGGIVPYVYASNNPNNSVDKKGLWSPKIHNRIILAAFPNLPPDLRRAMERGSEHADTSDFQVPYFSFMHAMRSKNQSKEEACEAMKGFVHNHLNQHEFLMQSGRFEQAYFELGMALHPIMDSTAPPHKDFQIWRGIWETPGYEFVTHWLGERKISDMQVRETVGLIRELLE